MILCHCERKYHDGRNTLKKAELNMALAKEESHKVMDNFSPIVVKTSYLFIILAKVLATFVLLLSPIR
jgi:hypothetical protein